MNKRGQSVPSIAIIFTSKVKHLPSMRITELTSAFQAIFGAEKMSVYYLHFLLTFTIPMTRIATFVFLFASLLPATLWANVDEPLAVTKEAPHELPPRKIARYAERLIARYDNDGDGILNSDEWASMQGQPELVDSDENGQITSAELIRHIMEYARTRRLGKSSYSISETPSPNRRLVNGSKSSETADLSSDADADPFGKQQRKNPDAPFHVPAKDRPSHLPSWFSQRDQNGDGQLSLAEFSLNRSRESVKAFQKLDANRDGLVTPQESVKEKSP